VLQNILTILCLKKTEKKGLEPLSFGVRSAAAPYQSRT